MVRGAERGSGGAALQAALKLLSHRAYSERKIAEKLRDKGFSEEAVREAIAACRQKKFLNDRELARDFIEQRLETRPRAGHVLVRELLKRGIPLRLAKEVVEENVGAETEAESAKAMACKKWKQYAHLGEDVCFRRVSSYLARRGYSWEMIREAIGAAQKTFSENKQEQNE
jgi:regulatory protein